MTDETRRLTLLLPDMSGGGAERVALALMRDFIARGHPVDLVLVNARGVLLPLVPAEVEIVDLGAATLRRAFLPLVRYLRLRRPHALHAMMWPLTVIAVLARLVSRLVSGAPTRIVLSDHIALSKQYGGSARTMRAIRWSVRLLYPLADARVLVSASAADDLAGVSVLPRRAIEVVHNPLDLPAGVIRDRSAKDWGNDGAARITRCCSARSRWFERDEQRA
jgi:hypothetical protein